MTDIEARFRERLRHFYEPDEIDLWMVTPHPLLDGRTAGELIDEGQADEVERVIAQLEGGVYL
jgi:uncharacterized protein (DUF2384 family)